MRRGDLTDELPEQDCFQAAFMIEANRKQKSQWRVAVAGPEEGGGLRVFQESWAVW
jgi:hypothetical protein